MCGLVAAFDSSIPSGDGWSGGVSRALDRMFRRGPDAVGFWSDQGCSLGHRRLAIVDLDDRSNQPMHSQCGRYAIVYNGEIYNFRELRAKLISNDVQFRTTSDTEVILALFAAEGEAMLSKLRGMFAFVIWDRVTRRGFVARDPYGIKPLYYAKTADGVVFASQVKALLATGQVSRAPDLKGQAGFWLLGSVPEPHTWYQDIRAIPAGHCGWIDDNLLVNSHSYVDIGDAWRDAEKGPRLADEEVRERCQMALRTSVANHLVADVPVGVFLSGGIDSGAVAGLMIETGARDLVGITIAYDEFVGSAQDEAPIAAQIAAYYGIRHHVRRVTRDEFIADLPRILNAMDQPSIDGINIWYASKAVAEMGLKVVVSGVGGDELFQGYDSFRQVPRLVSLWRAVSRIPGAGIAARVGGDIQARRSGNTRWRYAAEWARTVPGAWWLGRSLYSPDDLAPLMGEEQAAVGISGFDAESCVRHMSGKLPSDARLALSQIESATYLRNQLLRDSDWAGMDHSVELRTPLVDACLLEDLQPVLLALSRFPNKVLLAQAPSPQLPPAIIRRPKSGFGIPIGRWMDEISPVRSMRDSASRRLARYVASRYDQSPQNTPI